jgi:hypothetical protein
MGESYIVPSFSTENKIQKPVFCLLFPLHRVVAIQSANMAFFTNFNANSFLSLCYNNLLSMCSTNKHCNQNTKLIPTTERKIAEFCSHMILQHARTQHRYQLLYENVSPIIFEPCKHRYLMHFFYITLDITGLLVLCFRLFRESNCPTFEMLLLTCERHGTVFFNKLQHLAQGGKN